MMGERIVYLCKECGGSGTNPPGSPIYLRPSWFDEPSTFYGYSYTTGNTASIPRCEHCKGTGMEPAS